jgi:hypothetical protein
MIEFRHVIRGYLTGALWCGAAAFVPIAYDLTREDARLGGDATLRDHALHLLAEHGGDFAGGPEFGDAALFTTVIIRRGGRVYRRERITELTACKSIADLVDTEWAHPGDWD